MQNSLRREVIRNVMHAMPANMTAEHAAMHETELTRAARQSVSNADAITEAEVISEADFKPVKAVVKNTSTKKKRAARKNERSNRKKSRR
jgi:hypothetical protein